MAGPKHDLIVIGGGSGGLVCAVGAAMLGARVALVEKREILGGDCLNFGCIPSKALIRAARAAHELSTAYRFGLPATHVEADLSRVMDYVRGVVRHVGKHDDAERFRAMGVEVLLGASPRFLSPSTLQLGDRTIVARRFVIATGSRPAMPAIPGLAEAGYFDNETVFYQADRLPARLLVIGGGPIGLELGQSFARLGSRVTVAELADRLMSREDPEASALIASLLREEDVTVATSTKVTALRREGDVRIATLAPATGPGAPEEVPFDAILVAAGRRPSTEDLGLEAAGVRLDRGFIAVDDHLRTSARGIYACGDVIGRFPFTHMAEAEAKVVLRNALFPGSSRMDYSVVPRATFTEPEVARVGAIASELEAIGTPHRIYRFSFAEADRAMTDASTRGFVKLVATPGGKLLGATIVGPQAGELIHEYVLAMKHGLGLSELSGTIHVYPTLALANRRAADAFLREKLETNLAGPMLRWIVRHL